MTFSAFGIVMSVLILLTLFAAAVIFCIYRFAPGSGLSGTLNSFFDKAPSLNKFIQSERFTVIYSPALVIILFIEVALIIPIIISGFYLKIPIIGVIAAALFNGIMIPGLLYNRKISGGKEFRANFLINPIDRFMSMFTKGRK